jgi:uncharacterized protein YndB with AHSA1/START domain
VTVRVNHSPDDAFAAFASQSQVTTWLAEGAEIDPASGVYVLWGPSIPDAPERNAGQMELLAFDAPRRISFRWRLRGAQTTVAISFEEDDGATLVSFEHEGLPDADWSWTVAAFWTTAAENLRAWLERGSAGPRFDNRTLGADDIDVSVEIDAPASEVFRTIIEPELVERWMMTDDATIEPRVGGVYDVGWEQDGPVLIVDLEPNRTLAYSWRSNHIGYETLVTWELAESAGRTRLTLFHSGFAPEDEHDAYRSGWHNFLVQIKYLTEQGDAWSPVEWDLVEAVGAGSR